MNDRNKRLIRDITGRLNRMYQSQGENQSVRADEVMAVQEDVTTLLEELRPIDLRLADQIRGRSRRLNTREDVGALHILVLRAGIVLGLGA